MARSRAISKGSRRVASKSLNDNLKLNKISIESNKTGKKSRKSKNNSGTNNKRKLLSLKVKDTTIENKGMKDVILHLNDEKGFTLSTKKKLDNSVKDLLNEVSKLEKQKQTDNPSTFVNTKKVKMSNNRKSKIRKKELNQWKAVMNHSSFHRTGIGAIKEHLMNIAPQ